MISSIGPVMTHNVFLDLRVVDGQHLGRVVIRLRSHLRRAQHFMALCLGIWGGTYKGSNFSRLHETQCCTFLVGGSYRVENGRCYSTTGMMDGLEWDGEYAGDDHEGQIVSFGGGQTQLDSVFGICVREKIPGGRSRCPFGKVVEGLDVVQKAATFLPSTQVIIAKSGAILSYHEEEEPVSGVNESLTKLDINPEKL